MKLWEIVKHSLKRMVPLIVPILLIGFAQMAVVWNWLPRTQFAAPTAIIPAVASSLLWQNLTWTCLRLIAGVGLGASLGISTGLIFAHSRAADASFSFLLRSLAPIPIIIWVPFLIPLVGTGEITKILMVALGTFFLVHLHTYHSAKEEDRAYVELALIYQKSVWTRMFQVVLPASLSSIFTALRLSVALGWVVVALCEYDMQEGGRDGIGQFILQNDSLGRVEQKFAGMLLLALCGGLLDWLLSRLENMLRSWADDSGHMA